MARSPEFTYVTLPRDLPGRWSVMSRQDQTTVITLYQLKAVRQGGVLFDYRSQLATIAASFGYSVSKLRSYVQRLVAKGWATETHQRRHLALISTRRLAQAIGCVSSRFSRVEFTHLADLRTELEAKVVENALCQQRYQVRQKSLNQTIQHVVGIPYPENLSTAARRRYARHLAPVEASEATRLSDLPRYEQELVWSFDSQLPLPGINPDVTLGRRRLASLFGCTSSATGQRLAQRLVSKGLLTEQRRSRELPLPETQHGCSYQDYQDLRKWVLDYHPHYHFRPFCDGTGRGVIVRQLPNLLTPIPRVFARGN